MDDSELLEAWRTGDANAGNKLLVRYFPALWRFFRGKVHDDAEDLIQHTMLSCVDARDRVQGGEGFRAYLFRIARNQLIDHYRKRSTQSRYFEPVEHSVHDVGPLPSSVVLEHEEQKLLLAALRQLPLDVQLTIELYYWEGLSYAELAEVLDVSNEAIKKRLHRGRAQLREHLEKLGNAAVTSTVTRLEDWARSLRDCLGPIAEPGSR